MWEHRFTVDGLVTNVCDCEVYYYFTINFFSALACTASITGDLGGQSLILKLAEGHLEDAYLKKCLASIEKVCREFHLLIHMNFPSEHPVIFCQITLAHNIAMCTSYKTPFLKSVLLVYKSHPVNI